MGGADGAHLRGVPAGLPALWRRPFDRAQDRGLIAFLTERATIERILTHLGEPTVPPAVAAPEPESKGRAPPHAEAEFDQHPARDVGEAEPVPDISFDQTQGW